MKDWHVIFLGACILIGAFWIGIAIDGVNMNISDLITAVQGVADTIEYIYNNSNK
ncbi:hypothetical protein [Salinibacillus xinjiangensis]|uniref:Uncharacterized protein n=1 Tax=Salinibacillus xinjiangensis TaxID=1229268 RepID=A0A6G1X6R5_9BACI|nr:hypothetical protein [Salinibacillus xinjiangensis]MRG86596.1 hypothetical protein [Salinibacillus xinjiangensis]